MSPDREKNLFRITSKLALALTFVFLALASNAKPSQAADVKSIASLARSSDPEIATNAKQLVSMLQFRDWKSTAGTTLRARFGGIKDRKIILVKSDGEVAVPMQALSAEDQSFLLDLFTAESNILAAVVEANQQVVDELESKLSLAENKVTEMSKALESSSQELAMFKPGQGLEEDGTPVLTTKQIMITGEKYVGKGKVRMINARFSNVDTGSTSAPGADAGRGMYFPNVANEWLEIMVADADGELLQYAWARKDLFGDFFIAIKDNTKIDIEGFIYFNRSENEHQFIITKVTKSAEQK